MRFRKQVATIILYTVISLTIPQSLFGASNDQLLIILQDGKHPVEIYFMKTLLPEIKKIAEKMNVTVSLISNSEKLPDEVGITPLLIFQNHLGRSVYQGRTTTLKRIQNFIRTSRRIPQGKTGFPLTEIPIWKQGRNVIWAPLKISPVGGKEPSGYAKDRFLKEAKTSIKSGFNHFEIKRSFIAGRSDRGFYIDFYPWVSENDTLYLSMALFSQFHCKKPVFEHKITGKWANRKKLFKQAAEIIEREIVGQISDPKGGDGFVSVPATQKSIGWNDLGVKLPPTPPATNADVSADIKLPGSWQIKPHSPHDDPAIQFRFPAPLDVYSGEVPSINGRLSFPATMIINGMNGYIKADPRSVTMGEPDLDAAIQGTVFLDTDAFPEAKFIISDVSADSAVLAFGQMHTLNINGNFSMKGKTNPMSVQAQIEPIIGEKDTPLILITGSFPINLKRFDIEGATGPEPQKYTLLFDFNLVFSPLIN